MSDASLICHTYQNSSPVHLTWAYPLSHGQVVKSVLLFPTIERMASSPQGKVMTPVLCHLRYVVYLPIFLLSLLPKRLKAGMVQLVLRNMHSLDTSCVPATLSLINVNCAGESVLSTSYFTCWMMDVLVVIAASLKKKHEEVLPSKSAWEICFLNSMKWFLTLTSIICWPCFIY